MSFQSVYIEWNFDSNAAACVAQMLSSFRKASCTFEENTFRKSPKDTGVNNRNEKPDCCVWISSLNTGKRTIISSNVENEGNAKEKCLPHSHRTYSLTRNRVAHWSCQLFDFKYRAHDRLVVIINPKGKKSSIESNIICSQFSRLLMQFMAYGYYRHFDNKIVFCLPLYIFTIFCKFLL